MNDDASKKLTVKIYGGRLLQVNDKHIVSIFIA